MKNHGGIENFIFKKGGSTMETLKRFIKDEQGLETVEWAVIAALIVAGLIAVIGGLGTNVLNAFTSLQTATTP